MAPTTSYTAAPLKGPINLPPLPMMVHVTAPATLPAGYTFEAMINDDESKIINVEVVGSTHCSHGVDARRIDFNLF